jgi:isopentenyl-diphosphate Delta-isomerase
MDIATRKADHLALCATGSVGFRDRTTLLEEVGLIHDALPDLALEDIDLSVEVLGRRLRAPIIIAAMTGGTDEAGAINRVLASVAEERGYGFALGSQRAMARRPGATRTYAVRAEAPTALVLGNLGVVQARAMKSDEVQALVDAISVDALCIHLNPAMELAQPEGDRDFRGGLDTIGRLARELRVPVVVKETGCGLSRQVGRRLRGAGVRHVDVSGAGGTSWVGVEAHRASAAGDARTRALAEALWDWGVPTAASVAALAPLGFDTVVATGGVASGLDIARAIALGATAGGIARPVLRAHHEGGRDGVLAFLGGVEAELRAIMLLTRSRNVSALRAAPRVIGGALARWINS